MTYGHPYIKHIPKYSNICQVFVDIKGDFYPLCEPTSSPLNGILLHTPSFVHARFTSTGTGAREEARGLEDDKTEAWKRRKNKHAKACLTGPNNLS